MLILRGLAGTAFSLSLFGMFLILPAGLVPGGTWWWPRAFVFLGGYGLLLIAATIAHGLRAPASLQARLRPLASRGQPVADRVVTALLLLWFLAWLAFIPVDVFYLRLLPAPPLFVSACGGLLCLVGHVVTRAAVCQNSFAAPTVEDQADRGHVLIDTGLYARVRHPFYLGGLLFAAGAALWLESYPGLIATSGMVVITTARIAVEERALRAALPGYAEYTQRVRHRLVPFVW